MNEIPCAHLPEDDHIYDAYENPPLSFSHSPPDCTERNNETPLTHFQQAGHDESTRIARFYHSLLRSNPEITWYENTILNRRKECAYSNTVKSLRRELEDERGKSARLWVEVEKERERSRRFSFELEALKAVPEDMSRCKRKRIMKSPRSGFSVLEVWWVGLEHEGTLVDNLEFSSCGDLSVCPLQWLYVAGINRFWRGLFHCRDLTSTSPLEALTSYSRLHYSITAGGLDVSVFRLQDRRGEKRSLEWWAGAVSASQDVMECVQEQRGSNGVDLCCGTAFSGKLHVFQEVLLQNLPGVLILPYCHCIFFSAARAPTPDVLKWLCEYMDKFRHFWNLCHDDSFKNIRNDAVIEAAQFGRIATLKWLLDEGYYHDDAYFIAAQANQIETLQFLQLRSYLWCWDEGDCQYVRECGASDATMKWLHTQPDFPCSCNL